MTALSGGLLAMQDSEFLRSYGHGQVTRMTVGGVLCRRIDGVLSVLVLTRLPDDEYGGLEELPSGGVEPGETLLEALAREVLEETGLPIRAGGPFLFDFTYPSRRGQTVQLNFLVEAADDLPVHVDPAEHESARWLPLTELADSGLSPKVRHGLVRAFSGGNYGIDHLSNLVHH
ncbi:MAG TPA: NUDIX hydrolase [Streptosporangiaceae bacterium]|nr:NUDIX hydrolase [Streptosporangiaceae bacterium]